MKQEISVSDKICSWNCDSLKSIKENVDFYIKKYGEDAYLSIDRDRYNDITFCINYKREETDEEYKKRIEYETKAKEYRRQQYESLKKEFDDGN